MVSTITIKCKLKNKNIEQKIKKLYVMEKLGSKVC